MSVQLVKVSINFSYIPFKLIKYRLIASTGFSSPIRENSFMKMIRDVLLNHIYSKKF